MLLTCAHDIEFVKRQLWNEGGESEAKFLTPFSIFWAILKGNAFFKEGVSTILKVVVAPLVFFIHHVPFPPIQKCYVQSFSQQASLSYNFAQCLIMVWTYSIDTFHHSFQFFLIFLFLVSKSILYLTMTTKNCLETMKMTKVSSKLMILAGFHWLLAGFSESDLRDPTLRLRIILWFPASKAKAVTS